MCSMRDLFILQLTPSAETSQQQTNIQLIQNDVGLAAAGRRVIVVGPRSRVKQTGVAMTSRPALFEVRVQKQTCHNDISL